jgi:hypothetical protein
MKNIGLTLALSAMAAAPQKAERPVPFKVGETLTYDVSWSSYITAGTFVTTVKEKKPSYDSTAYYIVAEGRPTPLLSKLYSLYYKVDTLIDSYTLLPQRRSIYSEEGSRHRFRATQFDRKTNKAVYEYNAGTTVKTSISTSPVAQDALSAIYVLRAVPFKAGDRMTMPVSDGGQTYKGQFEIGGPERVKTGMGDTSAFRIKLTLLDDKNRTVGRNVALWMSDDAGRLPVKMQAEAAVGSFNLTLREAR